MSRVRVPAWQQARGCRRPWRLAQGGLVTGEDPGVADRRANRDQPAAQQVERHSGFCRTDAGPLRERLRRRRAVDVEERRTSSRRASSGSVSGAGTDQTTGARAPSQRIKKVPVVVAYRIRLSTRIPVPSSRSVIRRPRRKPCMSAARSSARVLPRASSGCLPSVKIAWSRAGTTKTLNRGPQTWTSDGSSQVDGRVPSTRAWMDSNAARGMLSCRPAQAACRRDRAPLGRRSSSAPTRRRKTRICARVSSSGGRAMSRKTIRE